MAPESPLLRLPVELRLLVFEYFLDLEANDANLSLIKAIFLPGFQHLVLCAIDIIVHSCNKNGYAAR